MADRSPYPDTGGDRSRESTSGVPRWLKVGGIIVAVLVLLVVVMMLVGGGGHTRPSH